MAGKLLGPEAEAQLRRVVRRVLHDELGIGRGGIGQIAKPRHSFVFSSTGAVTAGSATVPGSGTCTIYELTTSSTGNKLTQKSTITQTVFNTADTSILANTYFTGFQDEYGKYWAQLNATSERAQILIKNTTSLTVNAYSVFGLDGPVNTIAATTLTTYQAYPPLFKGTKPQTGAPGDWGLWAVIQQDTTAGGTGEAIMSGLTTILMESTFATGMNRLDIKDASHKGLASWYGAAELLDTEVSGGSRYGWIRLGQWNAPIWRATVPAGGLAANGSAACTFTDGSGTVTVWNDWMEDTHAFVSGDELLIKFNRHASRAGNTKGYWQVVSGEC